MKISAFAKALNVSPDTVRRLERRGVLTATRDWAGHRRFSDAELNRARAVLFGGRPVPDRVRLPNPPTIPPRPQR
jgi:excisionase family DNA binding protein